MLFVAFCGLSYGAYAFRGDSFWLSFLIGLACSIATVLVVSLLSLRGGLALPLIAASSVYWFTTVRVSISYLFSIPVDDAQLLIRGTRIATQFQPVGGVYKTHLSDWEMARRFGSSPDNRFPRDVEIGRDLRLKLKGRRLGSLIRWFDEGYDREYLPYREFHEELVKPGYLDLPTFSSLDCRYLGLRTTGFYWDKHSHCPGIIVAHVLELVASEQQLRALRELREVVSPWQQGEHVYFADHEEIVSGGARLRENAEFEIAPTAMWLIGGNFRAG